MTINERMNENQQSEFFNEILSLLSAMGLGVSSEQNLDKCKYQQWY